MHVYFVRHGETILNRRHVHQSPHVPLSSKGEDEARTIAEYLRDVNPSLLLSSSYTRAFATAEIIGLHTGLTPEVNELFSECISPAHLIGRWHFGISTLWYIFLSVIQRNNALWRYGDAENFTDISRRTKRGLTYIESLRGTHASVIIVSHTILINVMVAYMCKNRMLDIRDLARIFLHIKRMKNTGVIHVEYIGQEGNRVCAWQEMKGV